MQIKMGNMPKLYCLVQEGTLGYRCLRIRVDYSMLYVVANFKDSCLVLIFKHF